MTAIAALGFYLALVGFAATPMEVILDRIVGSDENGQPLVVGGISANGIGRLAAAAGVPMGIETARSGIESPGAAQYVTLTGQTLGSALQMLSSTDPRYEWREIDGVICIRPSEAWTDPQDVLNAPVTNVKLENVHTRDAMALVARSLGRQDGKNYISDTKRLSVNLPQGTILDVLNATVRANGELVWALEWAPIRRPANAPVCTLWMFVFGGGGFGQGIMAEDLRRRPTS